MSAKNYNDLAHRHAHGQSPCHRPWPWPRRSPRLRDYVIGFVLSVVLTAIPFWLVMSGAIADKTTTAMVIAAFAVVQVIVHMVYFLHMNGKAEGAGTCWP
jgi:cytochrome o ubiquinol oxidase operon protein cyoD